MRSPEYTRTRIASAVRLPSSGGCLGEDGGDGGGKPRNIV